MKFSHSLYKKWKGCLFTYVFIFIFDVSPLKSSNSWFKLGLKHIDLWIDLTWRKSQHNFQQIIMECNRNGIHRTQANTTIATWKRTANQYANLWHFQKQCHPSVCSWCWLIFNKQLQPLLIRPHNVHKSKWMNEWMNKPKFQRDEKLFNVQTDLHTLHQQQQMCTNVFGLKDLAILYHVVWLHKLASIISLLSKTNERRYRNILVSC